MRQTPFTPGPSAIRAVIFATIACVAPMATAFAQSVPVVKILKDETRVTASPEGRGDVLMTANTGMELEVIYTDGDRYTQRNENWYWVMLPRDPWGTRIAGWVSARHVQFVPVTKTDSPADLPVDPASEARSAAEAPKTEAVVGAEPPTSVDESAAAASRSEFPEVVLNFEFGKSNLTNEAKAILAGAAAMLKASQTISVAVEGHADAVGTEPFNEKLGRARAESVKRYLAEQHQIPEDKINVVSFGESHPAASNATREGRAQNRRVVVKVGL